jgi:hypothetical protein
MVPDDVFIKVIRPLLVDKLHDFRKLLNRLWDVCLVSKTWKRLTSSNLFWLAYHVAKHDIVTSAIHLLAIRKHWSLRL